MTKESLFLKKGGISDIFFRKKFVMSLFCIIFASGNGDERWPLLGSFWVRSGFALPSLWVRSGFAPKSGGKANPKRDEKDLDVV